MSPLRLAAVLVGTTTGCYAALPILHGALGAQQGIAAARDSGAVTANPIRKLMIFGGRRHHTYLGCLTCGKYESGSVLNRYGTHGSRYSAESIFNRYSDYGSAYSAHSACNPHATDPPVIVDGDGEFYGRLTLNRYHSEIFPDERLTAWLEGVCQA